MNINEIVDKYLNEDKIASVAREIADEANDILLGVDTKWNLFVLKTPNTWWTRSSGGKYKAPSRIEITMSEQEMKEKGLSITEKQCFDTLCKVIETKPGVKYLGKISDDPRSDGMDAYQYKGTIFIKGAWNVMYSSVSILRNTQIRNVK